MASGTRQRTPEQQHRREVRLAIMLPVWGLLVLTVLAVVLAALNLNREQFGLVADALATVFVLCPAVLICLIPTVILMASAIGLWKLNALMAPPAARGRGIVLRSLASVRTQVPRGAAPVIWLQGRLRYWEHLLTGRRSRSVRSSPHEEQTHGH